jgi:hypothetical protein
MKIQALNKTQQKRLLSLCKEFFPEYEYIWWNSCYLTIVFEGGKSSNNKSIDIHWYQLCLTELPKRIYLRIITRFGKWLDTGKDHKFLCVQTIQELTIDSNHPVDFLYNFVKECKKNKYFKNN